ncbi:ShlB/FhaC/HecB family hemolysin secretion/activation protein [Sphingobium subterraneum]|uniref:Hemolysin activation/secretion protein n=1 Tax=Sphingobium subterraneum TaxID=627688 RepID=A0A841J3N9_9SPHN|nr:ShlB/FhaC/HecB family hemolysin secretion/activation protein [Sphingobium subterraneum]MBB6124136.1 hemolysin activation/secretion protein [Sphingobium subterraneum]
MEVTGADPTAGTARTIGGLMALRRKGSFRGQIFGGWSTALLALSSAAAPAIAWAQAAPGNPPTREELDRAGQVAPDVRGPSRLTVEGGVERAPCALADPQYAALKVRITQVDFRGLKVVTPDMLADSWRDLADREMPIASLCEIRDRAATALRQMGYLAAVQVPPQRIGTDGKVTFDVLMAKLVGVQVRGDAGNSEKLIAATLDQLKAQPVFNVHEAERSLLLARDLPGYDVRLSLRPAGTAPGEVIGDVTVTREQVRLDVNIQSWGSHPVGRWGALARVQLNDITGMGDMTAISLFNTLQTREQTVLQIEHSMALNADGLRLGGEFTYAWSKPDIGAPVKSRTLIASAHLSYPLIRQQARTLVASGGLDIVNQHVDFGPAELSRDRLRVLFARLDGQWIDSASLNSTTGFTANEPRWRLGGSVELRHGLSGLGASDPCVGAAVCPSRPEGDASAFVLRASVAGEWRPVPMVTFALSPRGQYSHRPLLAFEEMSAGNYTIGRGYDPGTLTGDSGLGFASEVRLGRAVPVSVKDLAIQPYAFFDAMWMWNKDSGFNGLDPQKLSSAGGGVRLAWGNRGRIDFNLAVPLRDVGGLSQRGNVRALLSLTTQLWPWRP